MMNNLTFILLSAALAAAAAPSGTNKKMESPAQTIAGDSFELLAPGNRTVERKPDGVVLSGPSADASAARSVPSSRRGGLEFQG